MSNAKLFFFAVLFLFVSWAVWPQDTSQNTESESPQSLSSMSTGDLLNYALTLLDGMSINSENISSELTSLSELDLTEIEKLKVLSRLGMNEDRALQYLKTKMNLSEQEWQNFLEYWQNLKDGTIPSHDQKVHKAWRTAAIGEALLIIGMIIALIFL
jgi:hypothetical protein